MDKWIRVKISDLGQVVGGATPSTKKEEYYNGDIAWITPKDLSDFKGRYISRGERNITKAGMESCSTQLLPKNTILFSSRAPIGYVAIAENEMCTNQGFKSVIPNENVDYLFLYYLLKYNKDKIESMGSGTTFKEVSGSTMRNMQVMIPESKDVQIKIATILDSIDSKIENNQKINDNLEQQAIAIFNKLAQSSCSKRQLNEFIKIKHGYAFKGDYISTENNGIVLVTPGNFCIGGGFKENKCKYFTGDYPKDYVLQPNSLIVTMTDLSKDADTLGYSALVPQSSERVYLHNQRIGLVELLNTDLPLSYIYWYMRSYEYHMSIVGSASGSTVKHTSPGRILEQQIPFPDKNSLEQYAAILDDINTIVSKNNAENTYLYSLRESLLPKLMSGEIDVENAKF